MARALKGQNPRGLTIAEMVVSLTVLIMLMLATLNLFPSSMTVMGATRTAWLARAAAQNAVESLAALPYAKLEVGFVEEGTHTLSDGTKIELKTTVSKVDGFTEEPLKSIRCEASWPGRGTTRKSAVQELYVHSLRR